MSINIDKIQEIILEVFESSLEAQLRAIRRLKSGQEKTERSDTKKSMSQVDCAYDVLVKAGKPLHITEIINQVQKIHHLELDRDSLVSAITKKVKRGNRFSKTAKNTFKAM